MVSLATENVSHIIEQQFIHLDPIRFFFCFVCFLTVCFFGVKMAMIASSKTVSSPYCGLKINIACSSTLLYLFLFSVLLPHRFFFHKSCSSFGVISEINLSSYE